MPAFLNTISAPAIDTTGLVQLPLGSPEGLTLSRNATNPTTRLDIAAGRSIVPALNGRFVAISPTTFTKRLDAVWAQGSGNGGRFSGAVAANQTWHVFILRRSSDGAIDFGFDTSVTAANAPAIWDARMIGSIMTDGAGAIRDFWQVGDRFDFAEIIDLSTTNVPTATTNLQTLSVPTGIRGRAIGAFDLSNPTASVALFGASPDAAPVRRAIANTANVITRTPFEIPTNTSGQIRLYATIANSTVTVLTQGFIHPRGAW